jgi:hypothetical protein
MHAPARGRASLHDHDGAGQNDDVTVVSGNGPPVDRATGGEASVAGRTQRIDRSANAARANDHDRTVDLPHFTPSADVPWGRSAPLCWTFEPGVAGFGVALNLAGLPVEIVQRLAGERPHEVVGVGRVRYRRPPRSAAMGSMSSEMPADRRPPAHSTRRPTGMAERLAAADPLGLPVERLANAAAAKPASAAFARDRRYSRDPRTARVDPCRGPAPGRRAPGVDTAFDARRPEAGLTCGACLSAGGEPIEAPHLVLDG